jgi:ParB family chromosome partitioning protein
LIDPPAASIRQHMPELLIDELAESIRAVGLIEPMVVEELEGRFRIIAGHRRYVALKRAGITVAPVVVRSPSDVSTEAVQTHENLIRQDMTPAEEARLVGRLYDELEHDVDRVAGKLRMSIGFVNDRLELLRGDPEILDAIDREDIGLGVGQVLQTIIREDYRRTCLDLAIRAGATINLAKRWVAEYNGLAKIQTGEVTPQISGPAAAEYHPVSEGLHCWFCESSDDLDKLRMIQVHAHCVGAMDALMKRIGKS